MKKILILGAGFVSRPCFAYLASRPGYAVTIADIDGERAAAVAAGQGESMALDLEDQEALETAIATADAVVSLVPNVLHAKVASIAIPARTAVITTSYVQPDIAELDDEAKAAGVTLVNEVGLAPGIDHMTAMELIDAARDRGATLLRLSSGTGGLPAPEANTNPWGYKFSWSPRGVLLAGRNSARYLEKGRIIEIDGSELFEHTWPLSFAGLGDFVIYPNRDSVKYVAKYGVEGIQGLFRGSIRWPGWCETMTALGKLGLLDECSRSWAANASYAEALRTLLGDPEGALIEALAERLGCGIDDPVIQRLEFAGLLSDRALDTTDASPLDLLSNRLQKALALGPMERDLVVMRHELDTREADGTLQRTTREIIVAGEPGGDSAMSRCVGLPAAIATRLVLEGQIHGAGVITPIAADIYAPILEELRFHGLEISTKTEPIRP